MFSPHLISDSYIPEQKVRVYPLRRFSLKSSIFLRSIHSLLRLFFFFVAPFLAINLVMYALFFWRRDGHVNTTKSRPNTMLMITTGGLQYGGREVLAMSTSP
jgi:hypothetical protein